MDNTIYLVRHAKTEVDPERPIRDWTLSREGEGQAKALALDKELSSADILIASSEGKAYRTILPLARKLGKEVLRFPELDELDRDRGGFIAPDAYAEAVRSCLTNPDVPYQGPSGAWESARHALTRFSAKVAEIDSSHEKKRIVVCGHGFTINLYFASLLDSLDKVHERTGQNDFCDYGIVRGGKVIRDIVPSPSCKRKQKI